MTEYPTAWGKTDPEGGFHALAAHSMDVAAVFARLCRLPVVAARLECAAGRKLAESDLTRLAALVFLHDVGKLHPGFQAKGRSDLPRWPGSVSHVQAGGGLLRLVAGTPGHPMNTTVRQLADWGDAAAPLLMAIFAHHGRPVEPTQDKARYWAATPGYDPVPATADLLAMWRAAFPGLDAPAPDLPESDGFVHLVAGLTALADWIGSDRRFFPFQPAPGQDYPALAREAAAEALATVGMDTAELRAPETGFRALTGFDANPAQALIGQAAVESALVVLEAETGSGKTEAALWRFALLFAAGLVSGMYFAVPTRAAARQLHRRVNEALRRLFGDTAPEAVLAIPGQRVAGEAIGQALPGFETRWDDADGPQPARWAAEHATRFLAATVAVGTVDQAMLAALQVKHAHLRGAALSRSLLVIDEIHASDSYMTEVIAELLRGHLAAGGQAMLMSATLGSSARSRYLSQPQPGLTDAAAAPYPAVWLGGREGPMEAAGAGREKSVRMEARPGMAPAPVAQEAIAAARTGARVLVIRNTVAEAVAAFRAVADAGGAGLLMQAGRRPALHHSRFAAEDRALLDAAAEAALKPDRNRPAGGCIVIGSQTLEQSLDIDADLLITDLCPVDVLLQRIGRLHRHALLRPPGFGAPRCIVLCPEDGLDPLADPPGFLNGLGGWKKQDGTFHGIYTDLACLELTWRSILATPVWEIPAMNRALVEGATHPDARGRLIEEKGAAWQSYETALAGKDASQRSISQMRVLRRDQPFPDRFPDKDEQVMTRLGDQGAVIDFAPGATGPFGTAVTRIVLPAHWHVGPMPEGPVEVAALEGGFGFSLGNQMFEYIGEGLARIGAEAG